jgi:adenylosuccinate synthase
MAVDLLLGLQWGDEGKGKIVDVLTKNYDIIARFQGGPNAGHTLVFNGMKHVLHTIPSGIFHGDVKNLVGNGVVIDPVIFKKELDKLTDQNVDFRKTLLISRKAHLILPTHRLLDAASEASKGKAKIGSTLKGIGPTYMDKTGRNGIRVGDLELEDWKAKYRHLANKHQAMIDFYNIELEYDLDELEIEFFKAVETLKSLEFIDFGTYPFVTSSNTTAAGACTGLGVAPNSIKDVFGIFKAYTTRVGSGPFPTELFDENGETMSRVGHEFGATTGRARRCGWLDLVALRYACQVNGVTQLMMMKADVLSGFKTLKVCTAYNYKGKEIKHLPYNIESKSVSPVYTDFKGWAEDLTSMDSAETLPESLINYIEFLEDELQIPIKIVSVGPDRKQTIFR